MEGFGVQKQRQYSRIGAAMISLIAAVKTGLRSSLPVYMLTLFLRCREGNM